MIKTKRGTNGYKVGRLEISSDVEEIGIVPIGDSHLGSPHSNERILDEEILYIKEHPNVYVVLMGDLVECATKGSVGAGWAEQLIPLKEQIPLLVSKLSTIKDRILGSVKGNHEERAYKDVGFDPSADIMSHLGMPERYFGWELYFTIIKPHFPSYMIYAIHSATGNSTEGAASNWTEKNLFPYVDADIIMRGHAHKNGINYVQRRLVDIRTMTVHESEHALWNTGHTLERAESYAAAKGLNGIPIGTRVLWLNFTIQGRKFRDERI
jgi:predicted phosphodiesterase